jgi:hypothetical protein
VATRRDCDLHLDQVAISQSRLPQIIAQLAQWLESPHPIELNFSPDRTQTFKLRFAVEPRVICSPEKPVCRMIYHSFLTTFGFGCVVDQSCIRILHDSLAALATRTA